MAQERTDTLSAVAHPLCVAAIVLLLVNDHFLKAAFPSFLTGKLSDVAWLVVAPVALASLLSMIGARQRFARIFAVVSVGVAFTVLQLWPPLGDAWCAATGGFHTPDPTDLWTLPALALPWVCWSQPRRHRALVLPLAVFACLATEHSPPHFMAPSEACEWDPLAPLVTKTTQDNFVPVEGRNFADDVWIKDGDGRRVNYVVVQPERGVVHICPIGGLKPDTDYTWHYGPFSNDHPNELPMSNRGPKGTVHFRTSSSSLRSKAIRTQEACAKRSTPDSCETDTGLDSGG